jgi:hypothetical protein
MRTTKTNPSAMRTFLKISPTGREHKIKQVLQSNLIECQAGLLVLFVITY